MLEMNKDFYEKLPLRDQEVLNILIDEFGEEGWFGEAWERYRQYVLQADVGNINPPGCVFNLYVR